MDLAGGVPVELHSVSCLRGNFSQLEQPIGHWRRADGNPCEARDHGREVVSPIEAIFELGEVTRHVLLVDRAVGTDDGGLDVAQRYVDPLEGRRVGGGRAGASLDYRVLASGLRHCAEAAQAVADDLT